MSYGAMKSEKTSKFLKVKEGKPVNIHILTKSEDVLHQFIHMLPGNKRSVCNKVACANCQEGHEARERWTVIVFDYEDRVPKIYEFGFSIFNQIRSIAMLQEESGQTIHDIDLRIIATGTDLNTKYQVLGKPMKEPVPSGLVLPKLEEKEKIPF